MSQVIETSFHSNERGLEYTDPLVCLLDTMAKLDIVFWCDVDDLFLMTLTEKGYSNGAKKYTNKWRYE